MKRRIHIAIALVVGCLLAGCGGGSAYNIDSGADVDEDGIKIIRRTLQNDSDYGLSVELRINNTEYVDTIDLAPHEEMTVVIDNLDEDDTIYFYGDFDNGGLANGSFSEDGRTVFSYFDRSVNRGTSGTGASMTAQAKSIDDKNAVNMKGSVKRYPRLKKQ
jgi:hypothetical protein